MAEMNLELSPFDSKFNMGFAKFQRMHLLLLKAHGASIDDNHLLWKSCLDGLYRELWGYFDKGKTKKKEKEAITSKEVTKIDGARENANKKLKEYLQFENTGNPIQEYTRHIKQLALEESLSNYEVLLIEAMKNHGMDLPEKDNYDDFEPI